jgi:hypothetical protein
MAKISGVNCFMGVALDNAAWGTWKTHTASVKHLVKEDLHLVKPYAFSEFLSGHAQRLTPIPGQSHAEGTIEMVNSYEGCEHLIWYALGGVTGQNGPTLAGTGSAAAKFAFAVPVTTAALPALGLSITMERSLAYFKYPGCYVKSAEWQFKSGQPGIDRYTVFGPTETRVATAQSATNVRPFVPLLGTQGTITETVSAQSICAYIKEATVKIENPMVEDMQSLCSLAMLQPVRAGDMKISGSLTGWYDDTVTTGTDTTLYTPFAAGTTVGLSLVWSGDIITTSVSIAYRKEIIIPACKLTPVGTPTASGPGVSEVTWSFEAFYNGTDNPLSINLWNSYAGASPGGLV